MTKEELIMEAALILEQEGWLADRFAYELKNSRLRRFAERYINWQKKVNDFRNNFPNEWPIPPDNS
jgi:hypothetical protein